MAKKRNWFSLIKGIFVSDAKSKPEKKKKRWWRWVFGRHKLKRLPTLEAPLPIREKTLIEAEEEQSKRALTVAIATAAAADAAVAAAQAAAEVVRLTGNPQPNRQCGKGDKDLAAIKIQTAFRGYLARKALRALKGLVKLQAIIRGRAVRRQTIAALKCLQSIVNIQSQVCERKLKTSEPNWNYVENKQLNGPRKKVFKEKLLESNGPQKQDDSILSREARNSMSLSRRETMIKREHIKEYSHGNQERRVVRRPTESEPKKVNGRWSYWLEQWANAQTCKVEEPQIFDSVVCSNPLHKDVDQGTHVRLRNFQKWDHFGGLSSPNSAPRRSFHHVKQNSIGEDNSFSILTTVPTYMAATESAKAKARSISTPRQRQGVLDSHSDHNSPSKNRHYLLSSIDSEGTSTGTIGKTIASQQRSPSLKGMPVPIKSQQISKDLSIDSQFSLLNWDQHSAFR